jgi:hypothetical protein
MCRFHESCGAQVSLSRWKRGRKLRRKHCICSAPRPPSHPVCCRRGCYHAPSRQRDSREHSRWRRVVQHATCTCRTTYDTRNMQPARAVQHATHDISAYSTWVGFLERCAAPTAYARTHKTTRTLPHTSRSHVHGGTSTQDALTETPARAPISPALCRFLCAPMLPAGRQPWSRWRRTCSWR